MSDTYLALCQKFRQEVGVAGAGPATVVGQTGMFAKLIEWVADADIDIQSKWLDWDFLWSQYSINTINAVNEYAAPVDLGEWDYESFYLDYDSTTPVCLKQMEYKHWRTAYPNSETSTPVYYVIKPSKNVILYATPDDIYALTADYWKVPTRMTGNTSTSPIPSKFNRLIIARAKLYYAEHENAPEVMQSAVNEYNTLLHRLESAYLPGQNVTTRAANDMVIRPE